MTTYTKTVWVDEVLAGAERFDIKENAGAAFKSTMQIALSTSVTTPGTPLNAANLNNLENGVDACRTDINTILHSNWIVSFEMNGSDALSVTAKAKYRIPSVMNGMNLVGAHANCGLNGASGASSSGVPEISVQNGTVNMLSTNLTIDAGEYDSNTAAVPAVIDTAHDGVATGDIIWVEIPVSGTGVTYLEVTLEFALP
jgi:hypothetical protein